MSTALKILLWRPVGPLVKEGHVRSIRVPYTLFYICTILTNSPKNRHEVVIYDEMVEPEPLEGIELFDLIIAQINSVDRDYFLEAISKLNLKRTHLICIGQDPTADPKNYKAYSFYRGECELVLANNILNGVFEAQDTFLHKVENLLELPILKYTTEQLLKYNLFFPVQAADNDPVIWGQLLINRGCPHYCSFCTQVIRESYGHEIRRASIDKTILQIKELLRARANSIYFSDDDFTSDQDFLAELLKTIIRERLVFKWTAHARVDEVNESLLELMKQTGCVLLRFGVESGSEKIIKLLNKTKIPETWCAQAQEAFNLCHKLDLPSAGLFIIGSPQESYRDIFKTILLCVRLSPAIVQVHYFTAYPDSYYFKKNNGKHINSKVIGQPYHYSAPTCQISQIRPLFLPAVRVIFYLVFILRIDFIRQQIRYYFKFYLNNKRTLLKLLRSL